jgi:hypothetical protein
MRSILIFTIALPLLFAQTIFAGPVAGEVTAQPLDGPTPWVRFSPSLNKTSVDTTYIMGGPDSWDGSFDTPDGQPDWHGWTHVDLTRTLVNHWHVSTYWADNLEGHGAGNHAMYCGEEDIPACSATDTIGGYGDNYFDDLSWRWTVPNPAQASTLNLTGIMI